jgi:hypothetical protein
MVCSHLATSKSSMNSSQCRLISSTTFSSTAFDVFHARLYCPLGGSAPNRHAAAPPAPHATFLYTNSVAALPPCTLSLCIAPPTAGLALASALPRRRSLRGRPRQVTAMRDLVALHASRSRAAMPHLHPRTPEPRAFLARATPAAVAYARPPPDSPRARSCCSHASPRQTAAPELQLHAPALHAPPVPNPFQNFSLDQNLLELGSPLPHLVSAAATTARAAFWPLQPRNGALNRSCIASLTAAASPALQRQPLPPITRAGPSLRVAAALAPRASALRPAPATAAAPLLGPPARSAPGRAAPELPSPAAGFLARSRALACAPPAPRRSLLGPSRSLRLR